MCCNEHYYEDKIPKKSEKLYKKICQRKKREKKEEKVPKKSSCQNVQYVFVNG